MYYRFLYFEGGHQWPESKVYFRLSLDHSSTVIGLILYCYVNDFFLIGHVCPYTSIRFIFEGCFSVRILKAKDLIENILT